MYQFFILFISLNLHFITFFTSFCKFFINTFHYFSTTHHKSWETFHLWNFSFKNFLRFIFPSITCVITFGCDKSPPIFLIRSYRVVLTYWVLLFYCHQVFLSRVTIFFYIYISVRQQAWEILPFSFSSATHKKKREREFPSIHAERKCCVDNNNVWRKVCVIVGQWMYDVQQQQYMKPTKSWMLT